MKVLVVYITVANKREQQIIEDVDSVDAAINQVADNTDEYDILAYAEEIA